MAWRDGEGSRGGSEGSRHAPGAARAARLAAIYLALAIYGSLVPLDFQAVPLGEAWTRYAENVSQGPWEGSRSDWAANVLLFLPWSFLTMAAFCLDRPRTRAIVAAPTTVLAAAILSTTIEYVQIFLPARNPSLHDIIAETLGAALGVMVWLVAGPQITSWARRLAAEGIARSGSARLLPGYLALLVLVHVLPLDLTISPSEIYHKLRDGCWIPFTGGSADLVQAAADWAWEFVYYMPLGALVSGLPSRSWRAGRSWARVLGLGLATAALVEGLQLFVVTRIPEPTDAVVGGLAVLAGWQARRAWPRLAARAGWVASREGGRKYRRAGTRAIRVASPWTAILTCWVGLLSLVAWWPFELDLDRARIAARVGQVAWVPFADYHQGSEAHALDQFMHKALLFAPLGAILAIVVPEHGFRTALLAAALLAVGLEGGQLLLADRFASITDVLVQALGAAMGWTVARRFSGVASES